MSIPEIKVRRALKKAQEEVLRRGISSHGSAFFKVLEKIKSLTGPTLTLFRQGFRKSFNLTEHNRMLSETEDDVTVLFEEFFEQALRSLRLVDQEDLLLRRHLHEGKRANDILEFELLTIKAATGYFFGAFDTFRDVSKIDLTNSTVEIDLGTESIRLPRNQGGGIRLKFDHMLNVVDAPFRVLSRGVVSSRTVGGSSFANCFDDLSSSWQQEVILDSAAGMEGEITFPLRQDQGPEVFNAIYLDPVVRGTVDVQVLLSLDGVNFTLLPTPRPESINSAKLRIAGAAQEAKFLRIRFNKKTADRAEPNGNSVYYLGLRAIEVHRESFQREGTLITKALDPEDKTLVKSIDKISMTVEEELPPETDIEYYVAPPGGSYIQFAPINRPRDDLPVVVDFERLKPVPELSNLQEISSVTAHAFSDGSTRRNGIVFYEIYTLPETAAFSSVRLKRGVDAWRVANRVGAPEVRTEADNYIVFTGTDNSQQLYVNVLDEVITGILNPVFGDPTKVRTNFPILVESSFRPFATSGTHQQRPDYLIGNVTLQPGGSATDIRNNKLFFDETSASNLPKPRVYVDGTFKVLEFTQKSLSTVHKRLGRFQDQMVRLNYTYDNVTINDVFKIQQIFDIPDQNKTLLILEDPRDILRNSGTAISVTFQSLDVTEDVTKVEASGFTLDGDLEIRQADRIIVDYRRSLTDEDELFLDSIVVKDAIDGQTTFVEGRDYTIDPFTKSIYRDPAGQIRLTGTSISIRASFRYRKSPKGLYLYETWVTVPGPDPTTLEFPSLTVATGEKAFIYTNTGLYDLITNRRVTVEPGVHRIEVVSTPHRKAAGTLDTDSLIHRVINSADPLGEKIFSPRRYFSRQEAFNTYMEEIAFQRLLNSVRRNDKRFFVVDSNKVILNFDPTDPEDVLYLKPGDSSLPTKEKFAIGYSSLPASVPVISTITIKAVLKRKLGAAPEVSPGLFSFHVRMSHA